MICAGETLTVLRLKLKLAEWITLAKQIHGREMLDRANRYTHAPPSHWMRFCALRRVKSSKTFDDTDLDFAPTSDYLPEGLRWMICPSWHLWANGRQPTRLQHTGSYLHGELAAPTILPNDPPAIPTPGNGDQRCGYRVTHRPLSLPIVHFSQRLPCYATKGLDQLGRVIAPLHIEASFPLPSYRSERHLSKAKRD